MSEHGFDVLLEKVPEDLHASDPYPNGFDPFDTPSSSSTGTFLHDFDRVPPGPMLAALLSRVDPWAVSGDSVVRVLAAHQRMASHYAASVYEDMAAIADHKLDLEDGDYEAANEAAAMEVRAALRLTRRAADHEMRLAQHLTHRLPVVGRALSRGDLDARRARVIADGVAHLDPESAREVANRVLATGDRLTTGQLAARLRRMCFEASPDDSRARYETGLEQRRLILESTEDGTANLLLLNAAPDEVASAFDFIDRIAKGLGGDSRSIDQRRADVAVDLLRGASVDSEASGGSVDLVVDLTTLAGLDDRPGDLAGYGPVIADIARQVARQQSKAEWRWSITDPETPTVVANGITNRRPTVAQRRTSLSRRRTCVFPGCRAPAVDSDLDHVTPWSDGGPTRIDNLAPLCRSDHRKRHDHGWTYRSLPDGDYLWTSQLGNTYTTSGLDPPLVVEGRPVGPAGFEPATNGL